MTELVGLMCLLVISITSVASQQCSKAVRSITGKYLSAHVISSGSSDGLGDCLVKCSDDPRCKSINFRFKDLICELNDADRYTHTWDYESREGHAYSDYPYKATFKEFYMTPLWLESHASYLFSNRSTLAEQITFNAGSNANAALLKVPLVANGVLADGIPLTVEITVANDVSIGQASDSDIRYGVSDGTNFIGFETVDKWSYRTNYPCYGFNGTSGKTVTDRYALDKDAPNPSTSSYPEQFVFIIKLDKPWGSCVTAHGFIKTAKYSKRLLLSKGLTLEVYKSSKKERVGIKYIEVTIRKTGDY
ncbi:uncharacterized protein LOC144664313 [Oculina patagonica]